MLGGVCVCVCAASRQDNHVTVCVCFCPGKGMCVYCLQAGQSFECVCVCARAASRQDNHVNEPTNLPTNRLRAVNTPV